MPPRGGGMYRRAVASLAVFLALLLRGILLTVGVLRRRLLLPPEGLRVEARAGTRRGLLFLLFFLALLFGFVRFVLRLFPLDGRLFVPAERCTLFGRGGVR
jgi:hypothetical protein